MDWKTVRSNFLSVLNNKPIAALLFAGIGFTVGYYVKLYACT
ncbi:hypothetical protein [uncultured Mediterranean phage]|nr:hypothetical protein [uncultured Mediterranean phage]